MRPRRCRWVWKEPMHTDFRAPRGYWRENVVLTVDEFEAMRLKHLEKLDQRVAAGKMNISQPTFHRTLETAHEKVTKALKEGKTIQIKGGDYMTEETRKGVPKMDGSGKGVRANRGRGGCEPPQDKGQVWCKRPMRMRRRQMMTP
ncbi:MAG: DUF134 domain-containing protein [archaeon]